MPSNDPYAPTSWGGPLYEDFTTPSGQTCLIRKTDLMGLVELGLIDQVDSLGNIVREHIDAANSAGKPKKKLDEKKIAQDLLGEGNIFENVSPLVNKIVIAVVVKPSVESAPERDEDRQEGVVYVDTISLTDRLAIFNHITGPVDALKSDGDESLEGVGAVGHGKVVSKAAKRPARRK